MLSRLYTVPIKKTPGGGNMIPVTIKTFKGSALANAISLLGTFIDAIVKVIGVVCAFGMIGQLGWILGILVGLVIMILSSFVGGAIQKGAWAIAEMAAVKKLKAKLGLA